MEVNWKMVASTNTIVVFEGVLEHKNPRCSKCDSQCFALYQGGRKERVEEFFTCKKCNILYKMPLEKKCDLMEEKIQ